MAIKWRNISSVPDVEWSDLDDCADLYEALEVSPRVSLEVLKRAHRALIEKFHPDRHPPERRQWAEERAKDVNHAYGVLSDPEARARYDEQRRRPPRRRRP